MHAVRFCGHERGLHAGAAEVGTPEGVYAGRSCGILHRLFIDEHVALRHVAADDFPAAPFLGKREADALAGPLGLVLVHAEHDADLEAPVCCDSLVVLQDRRPRDAVPVEDFLQLVVIRGSSGPAVKLCEGDQLHRAGTDCIEQLRKVRAAPVAFMRREAVVLKDADDLVAIFPRPSFQRLPLVEDAFPCPRLLFGGDAAIKRDFHY